MVGVNVIAADTDAEARRLFSSTPQCFANLFRGTRGRLPPPIDDIETYWSPSEKAQASGMLACSFVGSPETVRAGIEPFIERTGADELIVASAIYHHSARLRSSALLAAIGQAIGRAAARAAPPPPSAREHARHGRTSRSTAPPRTPPRR